MRMYSLTTHRQSILAHVSPAPQFPLNSPPGTPAVTVPWKDWGPAHSRLFDSHDIPTRLLTASAGERYVRLAPDRHIHLLDFNPHHVRLELARVRAGKVEGPSAVSDEVREGKEPAPGSVQVVNYKTVLTHGREKNPWRDKLYSGLPYVLTVSKEAYHAGAVVIDEERLITLKKVQCAFPSLRCVFLFLIKSDC
jgi:hypothetical protein